MKRLEIVSWMCIVLGSIFPAGCSGNMQSKSNGEPKKPRHLTLRGHSNRVRAVAFSPDGKRLASGGFDGFIRTWNTTTGKKLLAFWGPSGVFSIAFSPDGKRLASGYLDGSIRIWDAAAGKKLLTIKARRSWDVPDIMYSIAFSPDGKRLVSGSDDKAITIWDTVTGKELLTLDEGCVRCVAFSPDGKRLASGGYDTITLWNIATGKKLLTLKGYLGGGQGEVRSVAFSPDGKRLASGSNDVDIKIWDTVTGKELLTLKGRLGNMDLGKIIEHADLDPGSGSVYSVAFSPDGKRLASGGWGGIKIWDTVTGKKLLAVDGHSDRVMSVAFSPDGKRLASGSEDKTVKIWYMSEWMKPLKKIKSDR
ncbi:MAG: WD40 repeat domain-containing protein [Phycisphaerae bacterium]|nr:WD40 repeat domain-containing protein [Phycisphaerae bacterium]